MRALATVHGRNPKLAQLLVTQAKNVTAKEAKRAGLIDVISPSLPALLKQIDGEFEAPAILLTPGIADHYDGLRMYRSQIVARGAAPASEPRERASWWTEPMFCGWGAQCARALDTGGPASALATQEEYEAYLGALEREGVVPGTVVVDDKWQSTYGRNEPDTAKWPDLRGWIASRHARGQRVLLWSAIARASLSQWIRSPRATSCARCSR